MHDSPLSREKQVPHKAVFRPPNLLLCCQLFESTAKEINNNFSIQREKENCNEDKSPIQFNSLQFILLALVFIYSKKKKIER